MTDIDRSKTDPFGNTYVIRPSKQWPGLFSIECPDRRSDWTKPKELKGHFTGKDRAASFLHTYLSKVWQMSDDAAERSAKRNPQKKSEDASAA